MERSVRDAHDSPGMSDAQFDLHGMSDAQLELEATRSGGDGVPIDPGALRGTERYLASADAQAARKNRREALRQVATVLAGRIYGSLYETLSP